MFNITTITLDTTQLSFYFLGFLFIFAVSVPQTPLHASGVCRSSGLPREVTSV